MGHFKRGKWLWGCRFILQGCCLASALLLLAQPAAPQTLARPGWAGSGMAVERWWPHAVLCEMEPGSLAAAEGTEPISTLKRIAAHLDDLQTLGVDAVLLRDLEPETPHQVTPAKAIAIDSRYGTLEDFDDLVGSATRHGMRVLVALRRGVHGSDLTDEARFWLNRGVTGLALSDREPGGLRAIRGVLHGYIGERVLIADTDESSASAAPAASSVRTAVSPHEVRRASASPLQADTPDLVLMQLSPVEQGAAAMRSTLDQVRSMMSAHAPVPLLRAAPQTGDAAPARVTAAAVLGSGGAVLLHADDLDLQHAGVAASQGSIFAWYRQWSGLHRGNAVMRSGQDTLLDHDAEGALVWVRQGRAAAPIVVICNVTDKPMRLSLLSDIQKLHLRGSFLRTVARSDGSMGAMPLREVVLPAYAVYAGELSR